MSEITTEAESTEVNKEKVKRFDFPAERVKPGEWLYREHRFLRAPDGTWEVRSSVHNTLLVSSVHSMTLCRAFVDQAVGT